MRRFMSALVIALAPVSVSVVAFHGAIGTASGTAGVGPFYQAAHRVASGTAGTGPFLQQVHLVASGTAGVGPFAQIAVRPVA